MDSDRATALLAAERARVEQLLRQANDAAREDRSAANESGDMADPAQPLTTEEGDDAIIAGLQDRLQRIERAEARVRQGTFGRSVKSGREIPDERLEADPAAELTVEEAAAQE